MSLDSLTEARASAILIETYGEDSWLKRKRTHERLQLLDSGT